MFTIFAVILSVLSMFFNLHSPGIASLAHRMFSLSTSELSLKDTGKIDKHLTTTKQKNNASQVFISQGMLYFT